ncbi:MAG: hypothetical protein P4L44_08150 [Oryzomonas sp.]|uniref:hypothetical protein n=1 Tax=Oryzomonas sp. TaxID=2855186 RepID=UPI00284EFBAA|nr:hypothetical protein [Oryzomonas sp.]MDR3579916.1 hypothetical protein [Oryzomonas sp.]
MPIIQRLFAKYRMGQKRIVEYPTGVGAYSPEIERVKSQKINLPQRHRNSEENQKRENTTQAFNLKRAVNHHKDTKGTKKFKRL